MRLAYNWATCLPDNTEAGDLPVCVLTADAVMGAEHQIGRADGGQVRVFRRLWHILWSQSTGKGRGTPALCLCFGLHCDVFVGTIIFHFHAALHLFCLSLFVLQQPSSESRLRYLQCMKNTATKLPVTEAFNFLAGNLPHVALLLQRVVYYVPS